MSLSVSDQLYVYGVAADSQRRVAWEGGDAGGGGRLEGDAGGRHCRHDDTAQDYSQARESHGDESL
jgi:hypothetical protein